MKLQELLAANQPLAMVYVLKEGLKGIWYAPSERGKDGDDGGLDAAGEGKRASAAATIWSKFIEIYAGDPGECKLPDAHDECAGRVNNKIKVIKAHGIWI